MKRKTARKPDVPRKAASPRVAKPARDARTPIEPVEALVAPAEAEFTEAAGPSPVVVAAAASGPAGLKLEPSCLLRDAGDLQFQLLAADFGAGDAMVDGSAVERVDTAGLQLLVAFVKHHESRGRRVGWTAASPELLRAARQLDLLQAAGLDRLASGSPP